MVVGRLTEINTNEEKSKVSGRVLIDQRYVCQNSNKTIMIKFFKEKSLVSFLILSIFTGLSCNRPDVGTPSGARVFIYKITDDGDSLVSNYETLNMAGDYARNFLIEEIRSGFSFNFTYSYQVRTDGHVPVGAVPMDEATCYIPALDANINLQGTLQIRSARNIQNHYRVEIPRIPFQWEGEDYYLRGDIEGPVASLYGIVPGNYEVATLEYFSGNGDEGDFYLHPFTNQLFITMPENGEIFSAEGDPQTSPVVLTDSYQSATDIILYPYEGSYNFYVLDQHQLMQTSSTGYTLPLTIQNAEGDPLSGTATDFTTIAINQDVNATGTQIIYAYNGSGDSNYGHKLMRLNLNFSNAMATFVAGGGINTPSPGQVVNGAGEHAYFNNVEDLAVDYDNNVYVADAHSIRLVTPAGLVTTFAGEDENGNYLGLPEDFEQTHVIKSGTRQSNGFIAVAYDAYNDRIVAAHHENELWAFWMEEGELQSRLIKKSFDLGSTDGNLDDATFDRPYNLQIDPDNGDIYFRDGGRIRIIRENEE